MFRQLRSGMRYKWLFLISLGINVIPGIVVFQRIAVRPVKPSRELRSVARSSGAQPQAIEAIPAKPQDKRFGWESVVEADVMKLYDASRERTFYSSGRPGDRTYSYATCRLL